MRHGGRGLLFSLNGSISSAIGNSVTYNAKMMDVIKAVFRRDAESGLSDRDRVLLSPVEKWRIFGRFPFKFLFHSLLCVLVLVEVRL